MYLKTPREKCARKSQYKRVNILLRLGAWEGANYAELEAEEQLHMGWFAITKTEKIQFFSNEKTNYIF